MKRTPIVLLLATAIIFSNQAFVSQLRGDDKSADDEKTRHTKFEELLSGVKLVGRFTIEGKEDGPLSEEEYTISKVEKTAEGDYWLFRARIKYGKNDYEVPLPLEVKWAGNDTPMITLTNLTILNQGPFSARVLFYDNKYAGTWSHGKVGGHLFGKIVKLEKNAEEKK